MSRVLVLSAKRTAIGSFGGTIKDYKPQDLASACAKECLEEAGIGWNKGSKDEGVKLLEILLAWCQKF